MAGHTSTPEARNRAVTKYVKNNYDRIEIRYQKESKMKQTLIDHAAETGENVQEFIKRAIRETLENDKKNK
jgi:uncharacterized protein (DUF1778 family)